MSDRISKLLRECEERTRLLKFIQYCKAEGLGSVQAEHDRLYTEQQEQFFAQYEEQMVSDAYLTRLLAELVIEGEMRLV